MDKEDPLNQIIFIKYEEQILEITTIEEMRIDMTEGIKKEHIYESPKNKERTRIRKQLNWLHLYKEGRKNYIKRKKHVKFELAYMQEVQE